MVFDHRDQVSFADEVPSAAAENTMSPNFLTIKNESSQNRHDNLNQDLSSATENSKLKQLGFPSNNDDRFVALLADAKSNASGDKSLPTKNVESKKDLYETFGEKMEKSGKLPDIWNTARMKDTLDVYHKEGYSQNVEQLMTAMVSAHIASAGKQGQFATTSRGMTDVRAAFEIAGHHGKFDQMVSSVEKKLPAGLKLELKDDPKGQALHTIAQVWAGKTEPQTILSLRGGTGGSHNRQYMVFTNREIRK